MAGQHPTHASLVPYSSTRISMEDKHAVQCYTGVRHCHCFSISNRISIFVSIFISTLVSPLIPPLIPPLISPLFPPLIPPLIHIIDSALPDKICSPSQPRSP
jgi:hypothetical protein